MKWADPIISLFLVVLFMGLIKVMTIGEELVSPWLLAYWGNGAFFSWWWCLAQGRKGAEPWESEEDFGKAMFLGWVAAPLMGPVAIILVVGLLLHGD